VFPKVSIDIDRYYKNPKKRKNIYGKRFFEYFSKLRALCCKNGIGKVYFIYYVQLLKSGHGKIDVHFLFAQFQIEKKLHQKIFSILMNEK
tara:strand:- start:254 stop:523 length:270 start_codon:yes stop_codon:yes gene_type:complete